MYGTPVYLWKNGKIVAENHEAVPRSPDSGSAYFRGSTCFAPRGPRAPIRGGCGLALCESTVHESREKGQPEF
jgi:hypothetical protein